MQTCKTHDHSHYTLQPRSCVPSRWPKKPPRYILPLNPSACIKHPSLFAPVRNTWDAPSRTTNKAGIREAWQRLKPSRRNDYRRLTPPHHYAHNYIHSTWASAVAYSIGAISYSDNKMSRTPSSFSIVMHVSGGVQSGTYANSSNVLASRCTTRPVPRPIQLFQRLISHVWKFYDNLKGLDEIVLGRSMNRGREEHRWSIVG